MVKERDQRTRPAFANTRALGVAEGSFHVYIGHSHNVPAMSVMAIPDFVFAVGSLGKLRKAQHNALNLSHSEILLEPFLKSLRFQNFPDDDDSTFLLELHYTARRFVLFSSG